jgi:hypothetical protein
VVVAVSFVAPSIERHLRLLGGPFEEEERAVVGCDILLNVGCCALIALPSMPANQWARLKD